MEKSQRTDCNEDTTNESIAAAIHQMVQFETPSVESRENGTNMVWVPCQPTEHSDSRSITTD